MIMPRKSTIEALPPDILQQLQELLRDPRVTQMEATHRINAILGEQDADTQISKSAVNRYSQRMEEVGAKLRQSREIANMWIGKLGATPQGKVGNLVNEIIRTLTFDVSLMLQEGELDAKKVPGVVKMLKDLALTMQRLEKAAGDNVKREQEIRRQAAEEAAETADKNLSSQGMSRESVDAIKRDIMGIAD